MIRAAFTLRLKPGSFAKYKEYHDRIWPELVSEIERSGIAQISTFENNLQLFLYSEIYDPEGWTKLWNSPIHDEWGKHMEPLMMFGADGKVEAFPLRQIFHLETKARERRRSSGSGTRGRKADGRAGRRGSSRGSPARRGRVVRGGEKRAGARAKRK